MVEEYNNQSQWAQVKGAFAQTLTRTFNAVPTINFVDGISAEKQRSMTQTGSTPTTMPGSTFGERLQSKNK